MSVADELISCYCSPKHVHSHSVFDKEWISLVDVQLPVQGISSSMISKPEDRVDWRLSSNDHPIQLLVRVGLARWEDVDEDGEFVLSVRLVDSNGNEFSSLSSCISDHGTLQDYFVFDLAPLMDVGLQDSSFQLSVHRVHAHLRKKSVAGRFFKAAKSSIKRALLSHDSSKTIATEFPLADISLSQLALDFKRMRLQSQGTIKASAGILGSFSVSLHVVSSDNSVELSVQKREIESDQRAALSMEATIYDGSSWRFCIGYLGVKSLIFTEAMTRIPVAEISILKIVRVEYFDGDGDQSPMAVHQLVRITMDDATMHVFYADCGLQWADVIHRAVWNQPFKP